MFVIPGIDGGPGLLLDAPGLTRRQTECLLAIALLNETRGHANYDTIGVEMASRHKSATHEFVYHLVRKGYVAVEPRCANTIRLSRPLVWRECVEATCENKNGD
jgi:hypothetical protein